MATKLRQSTAKTVRVGPFLQVGISGTAAPVAGLSVTNFDGAFLLKVTGDAVTIGDAASLLSATAAPGMYNLVLTANHADQIGELVAYFYDDSAFLPVKKEMDVLAATTYDRLYSESASGPAIPSEISTLSTGLATNITTLSAGHSARIQELSSSLQSQISTLSTGLATNITALSQGHSARIQVLSSSLQAQIATLSTGLSTNITTLSAGVSARIQVMSASLNASIQTFASPAAIADAVWDEARAGHTGALGDMADRLSDTWNYVINTLPGEFDAVSANLQVVDNNVDSVITLINTVSANLQVVDTNVDTVLTKIDSLSSAVHVSGVKIDMGQQLPASATSSSIGHALLQANTPKAPKRGVAYSPLFFKMVQSSDNKSPATSLTVTLERSVDGANYTAVAGTVTEVGNGLYYLSAGAADMNGANIIFKATAATANQQEFGVSTEPTKSV